MHSPRARIGPTFRKHAPWKAGFRKITVHFGACEFDADQLSASHSVPLRRDASLARGKMEYARQTGIAPKWNAPNWSPSNSAKPEWHRYKLLHYKVSVFCHLGGVGVFHHDIPAFSVSDRLCWFDAIDAHVNIQSVKPCISSLDVIWVLFQSPSCYVGLLPSHHMPIP